MYLGANDYVKHITTITISQMKHNVSIFQYSSVFPGGPDPMPILVIFLLKQVHRVFLKSVAPSHK